jgi:aminoglycoside 2'-N-acetyltransferase I
MTRRAGDFVRDVDVRVFTTDGADPSLLVSARRLMTVAFGDRFDDDDWAHGLGGWHAAIEEHGEVVAHASVVPRRIEIGGAPLNAGYVEAVATDPSRQRAGYGTTVMEAIDEIVRQDFEVGVLATSAHHFYERLGWQRWRGPTFVRVGADLRRTPDEDDGVMVLRFGPSADCPLRATISCDSRQGDAW